MEENEPIRGRNYSTLAFTNPIFGLDERISYEEDSHTYHVDGALVPISVTKLLKRITDETEFDADGVITKNIGLWRRKPRSEYGAMILGLSDDEARVKIKQVWVDANRLGTQLHLQLEALMNSQQCVIDEDTTVEWEMVKAALCDMAKLKGWKPYRSELSVFYEAKSPDINAHNSIVVCAGQIDALFTDENDHLVIVDLKRVKRPLEDVAPFGKKVCLPPMDICWANEFVKYSLQLSMYCVMVEQRTGVKIDPENRFLLQAHPNMNCAKFVKCDCFDKEARFILNDL